MSEDQKPKKNEPSFEAWVLLYSYLLRTTVPRILKKRKQEQEHSSSTARDVERGS